MINPLIEYWFQEFAADLRNFNLRLCEIDSELPAVCSAVFIQRIAR